jgi:hypothetical protein
MTSRVRGAPATFQRLKQKQHADCVQLALIHARTWHCANNVPLAPMALCQSVTNVGHTVQGCLGCRVGICETVSVPGDLGDETETVS